MYFWSAFLGGTATWLEAILFLAGVASILLEIFVLPGSAIFGLGGGLMVLVSLVLASQTFVLPHNEYQTAQLRNSLLSLVAAGAAVLGIAALLRKYLPHTPMLGQMVLAPPSESEFEAVARREALVDFAHLVGQHGRTTTQLTPSGKARFGADLIDVISDGELVPRGTEIVVVEVSGNRVLVRPVA
jgi:membrane-bound ClpP family serine protease